MFKAHWNMALWALRDLMRRPGEALITAGVLILLTVTVATPLLITRILSRTVDTVLSVAPAMVVRRIDPTGWRPIPLSAAATVSRIPGTIAVSPRIWGRVPTTTGAVTVIAWIPQTPSVPEWPMAAPAPGTLVAGPGIPAGDAVTVYRMDGTPATFVVAGRLPGEAALPAADLIIMHPGDARALLGIPAGHATDLTVDVFYETEIPAIATELIASLPFPVNIDDRKSAAGRYHAAVAAGGGSRVVQFFPALAALSLLVLVTLRQGQASIRETGLLNAVGWSATDIHRRDLSSALWVGLPSVAVGALASHALVTQPALAGLAALLWGRPLTPGISAVAAADLGIVLMEASALVLIPFVVSVALTGLVGGTRMAGHWLRETGGRP